MSVVLSGETLKLAKDLESLTGENVMLCYQCKKCTLGCPAAYTMKMRPHELMRATQLGLMEEIYWSGTIWICLSCETCNTRCPQDINILRVIDGLTGACHFEEGRLLQSPPRDPRAASDLYGPGGTVWKGVRIGSGPAHQSEDAHPVQRHRHGLSHVLEGKTQAPSPFQPWGKRTPAGDVTDSQIRKRDQKRKCFVLKSS